MLAGLNKEFSPERRDFLTQDYSRGFIGDIGYEVHDYRKGYLESRLKVLDRHRQQDQYIHAGVLAAMADHTAGYAAFSLVDEEHRILTIEFKINFLQPAYGHGLICKSRILREGGRVLVGESEIFDRRSDGKVLAAKALVTLIAIHRSQIKPVPGVIRE
jgi:uncharacterized protein (TIGR00369 family)